MKRTFDIVFAGSLLIITFPLYILVWLVVLVTMGLPVLFIQERPGLHGRIFRLYKFRTMMDAVDSSGQQLPDAKRLTLAGRWIRKFSLDELPQLFNVLQGDMSVVGPRPLLIEYLPLYTSEQSRRHNVKPGITGWAQVNGRNTISWEDRFKLDVWYVDNQSFFLDMKIILLTMYKVIRGSDITEMGQETMSKFTGSTD